MTVVPLPASPCVRVRMDHTHASGLTAGSRFYLSYSGSAPSGANCTTLAGDVATAWNSNLDGLFTSDWTLVEVDVLDIATDSGLSGTWSGSHAGTGSGTTLPAQCAINIEYNISRRYRGGKPRIFLPPGVQGNTVDDSHWSGAFVTEVNTAFAAFIAQVESASVGSMGTLAHVNLSYYKGFTNQMNTSGRERAVPTYRATAILDTIVGYSCKSVIGSQRRRRTSTTP